jgi:transposase InsO family protein
MMCRLLDVSASGYYEWRGRPPSARARANQGLVKRIAEIQRASRGTYGSPRVTRELRAQGEPVSENRVARLMQAKGIRARQARRFKATTYSGHGLACAPNRLARQFGVADRDKVWASDITYLWTDEGWVYLAVVLDLGTRAVVGWAMSDRLTAQLACRALQMALWRRKPAPGLLHHSDRGVQYASGDYQALLAAHGIHCSMSGKGNCYDNAVVESFFHTLKVEQVHHCRYRTREQARQDIFEWIEVFYNRQRRHSALGYRSPAEFEKITRVA